MKIDPELLDILEKCGYQTNFIERKVNLMFSDDEALNDYDKISQGLFREGEYKSEILTKIVLSIVNGKRREWEWQAKRLDYAAKALRRFLEKNRDISLEEKINYEFLEAYLNESAAIAYENELDSLDLTYDKRNIGQDYHRAIGENQIKINIMYAYLRAAVSYIDLEDMDKAKKLVGEAKKAFRKCGNIELDPYYNKILNIAS